ncbi:MAG: aminoacyl-tRNA hydrolase [Planctomycetota bacterium]|nr:aminoacyl-tRNA hydrolase [Planctomycetota bacterium]
MQSEPANGTERTKFVAGLGNPGRKYENTRHNVGFLVVDELVRLWQADGPRKAFQALLWDARRPDGQRVMLMQPQTYMNLSGRAVAEMMRFHKASCQDLLVVLDDWNLPLGQVRLRAEGSPGGHKGLTDVLASSGTNWVPRLRIGIGSPPPAMDPVDFVLTGFAGDDRIEIESAVRRAAQAVQCWLTRGIEAAMNEYNRREESETP